MPVTSLTPQLTRLTILAVAGATALSIAACGTSNNAKPTSSSSPTSSSPTSQTPAASGKGKDLVSGLIASVSGTAIQVTQQTSTTSEAIAQGECIMARGTRDGGGALQATTINLQPADNGNCPQAGGKRHAH